LLTKNGTTALLLVLCLLLGSMTGCASPKATAASLTEGITANTVDTQGALTEEALKAARDFATALWHESLAKEGENTLVSPLSVFLALGMTANGAQEDTLSAFQNVLGLPLDTLNLVSRALAEKLMGVSGSTILHIANSIWYDEDFQAHEEFLQTNVDYFGAAAYQAPFRKAETVTMINNWVKDRTQGLIPDIIDRLDPANVMVLVNTLYLNAKWQQQFDPADTDQGNFTLCDGSTVAVDFMSNDVRPEQVLSHQGAQGVLLPYDDDQLAYIAVLPPAGMTANQYAATLNGDAFSDLLASAQEEKILLLLPKYASEYDITLNEGLKRLGLARAFDPELADFGRMGTAGNDLFISQVIHKTRIEVAEKGTEAAAATGVVMDITSALLDDYRTIAFNRPFVYAVVDLDTGLPLFLGVLANPVN
jgi:serpin B